ncbi:MAG: HIRAN domain-containing protein [Nitrococcus mobilis]|nr:HIRAN domain-containing protein [Nitrococcus mobilis]
MIGHKAPGRLPARYRYRHRHPPGLTISSRRAPLAIFPHRQRPAPVREPANPHDPKAVRIDWHNQKLGYVPRDENTAISQMLDRGERLGARPSP